MIRMKKNGNWDDVSLKSTMESVEICSKIQTTSQTWVCLSHHYGVICIALHNLEKEAKARVLQKEVEVALVEYMKMMQAIKQLITFTQLHLKVVEITQKSSTLFKNGIPRWGWLRWFKKPNLDFSLRVCKGALLIT